MGYASVSTENNRGTDPRYSWLRPKRNRQLASVVVLASIVGFMITAVTDWVILSSLFLLIVMVGWWLLRVSIQHVMDEVEEKLDERMLMRRDQMYRSAYMGATATFIILWAIVFILVGYFDMDVTMNHLYGIGVGFFWFMVILPTIVYGWIESEV